ncbi:MAG: hypothetical protein OHK0029_26940 [Armatimonadaceae bacterium]
MHTYQVRYWFDSNSGDRSGEYIVENIKAASPQEVARQVEAHLSKNSFVIQPVIGPAQGDGLVVIQSPQVRFVEIVPTSGHHF